jgi:hypothetical protein
MVELYFVFRRYKIYVRIIRVKSSTAITLGIIPHHYLFEFRTRPSLDAHKHHKKYQKNQKSTTKKIGAFSLLI